MSEIDGEPALERRHLRWVLIATLVANALVVNEVAFVWLGHGVRVPAPVLEHYGRLVPLLLPPVLYFATGPEARVGIASRFGVCLLAVGIALLSLAAGAFALVLTAAVALSSKAPGPLSIGGLGIGGVLLWLCMRCVRRHSWLVLLWLPPAMTAGTSIFYGPPLTMARIDEATTAYVIEAGIQNMFSDSPSRVCAVHKLLPGVIEWWHELESLPSTLQDMRLHREGAELVVEGEHRPRSGEPVPRSHRIPLR